MRKFLVPRTSIENANVMQPEAANEFNPNDIVRDPGCRKQIDEYAPDIQDQVRRAYILKGPTQPNLTSFPRTQFGKYSRAFCSSWYKSHTWIEYSESKDAAYCFYCFLFKSPGRAEHFKSLIVTTTSASCKRRDALMEARREDILSRLKSGEISQGTGLHQSSSLARPGDTRWGSHYTTLIRLDQLWFSVLEVLSIVDEDGRGPSQAAGLIEKMESFKFAFILKLMLKLFGITNELSKILQRKDLNIVLAMELVDDVKYRLATLRDSGWDNLFFDVQEFCVAKGIPVPNMDEEIPIRGRSRKEGRTVTNLHHYRAEIFYVAIDKICVEMDHRFSEGSNNVLNCFSCLDPKNSFSRFDIDKLARLADIYHADFSDDDRGAIREQLDNYVHHVKMHASFTSCEDVESLAMKMVQTQKHLAFPLVYKLIELALLLPVSTASVERAFSAMKIIKSKLRNKINDVWFNDLMICYTEREIFKSLQDVDIMRTFTRKKSRKGHLPLNFI